MSWILRVTSRQFMAQLPYLASPGVIKRVLEKIQEARRPERFSVDFLETKLGQSGGAARATIPLLKRMGFLNQDGTPSALYDRFRNPETQRIAVAEGVRAAFHEIFSRNEYAGALNRDKLTALVTEISGHERDSTVVKCIVGTFWNLRELADFEQSSTEVVTTAPSGSRASERQATEKSGYAHDSQDMGERRPIPPLNETMKMSIGYNINLNLPETTNPDVFNAIFRALKEHLLRD
jgi:hypothetical protein